MQYYLFQTKMGWSGIAGRESTISKLVLPKRKKDETESELLEGLPGNTVREQIDFSEQTEKIKSYFAGNRIVFDCRIAPVSATNFDLLVWEATRKIPYGETRSYKWIAGRIGDSKAARAVGQALGRNPVPIIVPCHRVLCSDGGLGGFSSGLDMKRSLLELEYEQG